MNAVEFLFALFAVFGSTALWFLWLRLVYKIDLLTEGERKLSGDKEEKIN